MNKTIEERVERLEKKLGHKTKKTTRILVIQDRSGSMHDRVTETIDGYNEYISDLASDKADNAYLTLVQFDDEYEVKEEATPVTDLEPLDEETYVPRGMTALLDAVGRGVTDLKRQMKKGDRALVVIMTDGMENYSRKYNKLDVVDLIRGCEKKGNWTFVFLGAGQDSWSGSNLLGLRRNQAVYYRGDAFSHRTSYAGLSATTSSLRGGNEMSNAEAGVATASVMAEAGAKVKVEKEDDNEKEE